VTHRGQAGTSPYFHRGHSSCLFAAVSHGGDTVHAGRATVMPRNKPALFRSPVRPGESRLLKIFETTGATSR